MHIHTQTSDQDWDYGKYIFGCTPHPKLRKLVRKADLISVACVGKILNSQAGLVNGLSSDSLSRSRTMKCIVL